MRFILSFGAVMISVSGLALAQSGQQIQYSPAPVTMASSSQPGLSRAAAPNSQYGGARPQPNYVQSRATVAKSPAASDGNTLGRFEGRVGWDSITSDTGTEELTEDGVVYGFGGGFDHFVGDFFIGGFASIDWTSATTEGVSLTAPAPTTGIYTETEFERGYERDIELGVRAGMMVTRRASLYAFAALTNLKRSFDSSSVVVTPDDPMDPNSPVTRGTPTVISTEEYQDGWRYGLGSEITITEGMYAKAEYRYTDYGEEPAFGDEMTRQQFMTGVGLRF